MNMIATETDGAPAGHQERAAYARIVAFVEGRARGDENCDGKAWKDLVRGTSVDQRETREAFAARMRKSADELEASAAERRANMEAHFADRRSRLDEGLSVARVERSYNKEGRIYVAHVLDAGERRYAAAWGAAEGHMLVLLSYMHLRSLNQTPGAEAVAAMMTECAPQPRFVSPSYVREALKSLVASGHLLPVHRPKSAMNVYRVTIYGFNAAEACRADVGWTLPKPFCPPEA